MLLKILPLLITIPSAGEDGSNWTPYSLLVGMQTMHGIEYDTLWKRIGQFLIELNIHLPYDDDPTIIFLGFLLK